MFISHDDILYCKNKEQHQVVSRHALKEAVFRELHINMTRLGADRTLQCIRERFYLPKMEEKVRRFINNQHPCVRQKKPHIQGKAPLLSIISSAPLEIVEIDFFAPKKVNGGFEHILRITDILQDIHRLTPLATKLLKLLLLISSMTLFFTLVFHLSYRMIKEENLRMLFSNILQICRVSTISEPPLPHKNKLSH